MITKGKKWIPRWLPGLIVSSIVFVILIQVIDMELFLSSLRAFKIINILVFILLFLMALLTRGLAWKYLVTEISYKDAFLIINEGYLFNNLIPRSGEIARAIITSSVSEQKTIEVASSIIFERSVDVIIAAGMFLATLPMVVSLTWIKPIAWTLLIVLMILVMVMLIVAANSKTFEARIENMRSSNKLINQILLPGLKKVIQALSSLNKPKHILLAVMCILITWFFWTLLLFYGMRLIVPDAPFWWSIFAEGVLALGIALPSAPANLGVYEGTMVVALTVFGITADSALSLAIILHFIQIIMTSLIGIFGLVQHGLTITETISKIHMKIRKEKNGEINA